MTKQEKLNNELIEKTKKGHLEEVKSLIKQGADVNVKDNDGNTALISSSYNGHLEIEQGADVEAKDKTGKTALIESSSNGCLDIVKCLLDNGADVEAKDKTGKTALIWSSNNGHLDIVKYLIEQGADVNVKNNDGNTALIWSSFERHLDIVKYLIKQGADINVKDNNGYTALHYIKRNNMLDGLIPYVYNYMFFEELYNDLRIEQKHILFKHFMKNKELLEQVNPRMMKNFIPDINKWKNNLK